MDRFGKDPEESTNIEREEQNWRTDTILNHKAMIIKAEWYLQKNKNKNKKRQFKGTEEQNI